MTLTAIVTDEMKQEGIDILAALRKYHSDTEIFALIPAFEKIERSDLDFLIVENGRGGYAVFPDPEYGSSAVMTFSPGKLTMWNEGFEPTVPGYAGHDILPTYKEVAERVEALTDILSRLGIEVKTHSVVLDYETYKQEVA